MTSTFVISLVHTVLVYAPVRPGSFLTAVRDESWRNSSVFIHSWQCYEPDPVWGKKWSRSVPVMLWFATVHSWCSGASRYTTALPQASGQSPSVTTVSHGIRMAKPRCYTVAYEYQWNICKTDMSFAKYRTQVTYQGKNELEWERRTIVRPARVRATTAVLCGTQWPSWESLYFHCGHSSCRLATISPDCLTVEIRFMPEELRWCLGISRCCFAALCVLVSPGCFKKFETTWANSGSTRCILYPGACRRRYSVVPVGPGVHTVATPGQCKQGYYIIKLCFRGFLRTKRY